MNSSEDLATPCLQPCTPALPDGSGHNTTSCHLLPTRGRPLPPPGHGLIVLQKCLQPLLSMSSWALLPGVGADPHRARTGSDMLPHGPCYYMRTLPVGASQPSRPVDGSQRLGDRPLSLGSCTLSGHQSAGGRKWRAVTSPQEGQQPRVTTLPRLQLPRPRPL